MVKTILYIHGMGGGGDSRIPSILNSRLGGYFPAGREVRVIVRTYPFKPEDASATISLWVEELHPDLVIGESLGSVHALAVKGVPHILVSPSLGAPRGLTILSWLSLIPGMGFLFSKIWHPKEGDRQELLFDYGHLRGWMFFRRKALDNSPRMGGRDYFFAFFGTRDHYRRLGVVSVRKWRKYFGKDSYLIYDGTHFMEEEYILSLLIPKIIQVLDIKS